MTVTANAGFDLLIDAFPHQGTLPAKLRHLVNFAILAPSSHNSQPWLFKVQGDKVELYADRSRALSVVDPDDRELIISCGAALHHLQVAAHEFGFAAKSEPLVEKEDYDLLARVRFSQANTFKKDVHDQFIAMPKRHTFRYAFEPIPLIDNVVEALKSLGGNEVWLEWVEKAADKEKVAELIAEADRVQWHDPRFRRELASWCHANRSRSNDGMPGYAMGLNDVTSSFSPLMIRTFDMGQGRAARDKELALASPVLVVMGTKEDNPEAWVQTGQLLSEFLLRARAEGVFASYLNQPVEVPDLRLKTADIVNREGFPQLILRLGYGYAIPATPRRDVHEVLL